MKIIDGRYALGLLITDKKIKEKLLKVSPSARWMYIFIAEKILNQKERYDKRIITLNELIENLGLSERQIKRLRKELKENNLLWIGTYVLKKKKLKVGVYKLILSDELYHKFNFIESPLTIQEEEICKKNQDSDIPDI